MSDTSKKSKATKQKQKAASAAKRKPGVKITNRASAEVQVHIHPVRKRKPNNNSKAAKQKSHPPRPQFFSQYSMLGSSPTGSVLNPGQISSSFQPFNKQQEYSDLLVAHIKNKILEESKNPDSKSLGSFVTPGRYVSPDNNVYNTPTSDGPARRDRSVRSPCEIAQRMHGAAETAYNNHLRQHIYTPQGDSSCSSTSASSTSATASSSKQPQGAAHWVEQQQLRLRNSEAAKLQMKEDVRHKIHNLRPRKGTNLGPIFEAATAGSTDD